MPEEGGRKERMKEGRKMGMDEGRRVRSNEYKNWKRIIMPQKGRRKEEGKIDGKEAGKEKME